MSGTVTDHLREFTGYRHLSGDVAAVMPAPHPGPAAGATLGPCREPDWIWRPASTPQLCGGHGSAR